MTAFNKFDNFVLELGSGLVDLLEGGDALTLYLTNNVPDAGADSVKADLAGITEENGYAVADILNIYTESGGVGTMTSTDVVWTGTGAGFGPFRYVVMYNAVTNALVGWYDHGSSISIAATETFTVDFGATTLTIT